MLKIDDLTNGLRPLNESDAWSETPTYDPSHRNVMVDDPATGRRPAITPSDLWDYPGAEQRMVDDAESGRHPIGDAPEHRLRVLIESLGGSLWIPNVNNFEVSDGTTPAEADSVVGYVDDVAGTNNATQATTANKPFLRKDYSRAQWASGQRGGAGPELGAEVTTNGSFDTDTAWTKGTAWSISGGNAICDGSQSAANYIYQACLSSEKAYAATIVVSAISGYLDISFGNLGALNRITTAGTYTIYGRRAGNNNLLIWMASSGHTCTISSISGKELLTGTGETWSITNTAIADTAGIRWGDGEAYLRSIAVAGNIASTVDSAANSITGDSTWIFAIAPESWDNDATQLISGKYGAAGQRTFYISINSSGKLVLTTYADGTTAIDHSPTTALSSLFSANQEVFLRILLDVDNGAAGHDFTFQYSLNYDPVAKTGTWTTIDTTITTAGTTSLFDSTAPVVLGSYNTATASNLIGNIRYFAQWANLTGAGTPAYEFYPQRDCVRPKSAALDFDNSNDYLQTPINPTSSGYLCVAARQDEALGGANVLVGAYKTSATIQAGVALSINASGNAVITRCGADGSTDAATSTTTITAGVPFVVDAEWTADGAKVRINGAGEGVSTGSKDAANAGTILTVGARNTGTSAAPAITDVFGGAVFGADHSSTVPTAAQQAIIRKLNAQIAGVSGVV